MRKPINRPRTLLERSEGLPPPHPPNPRPGQWVPPKNAKTLIAVRVPAEPEGPTLQVHNDTPLPARRKMMSVDEAADYWGVHVNTIRNWTKQGTLPTVKVPGCSRVFYDPEAMDECARKWQSGGVA